MFEKLIHQGEEWIRRYDNAGSVEGAEITTAEVDKWYSLIYEQIIAAFGENSAELEQWKKVVKDQDTIFSSPSRKSALQLYREEKEAIVVFLKTLELQYQMKPEIPKEPVSISQPFPTRSSSFEKVNIWVAFVSGIVTILAFVGDQPIVGGVLLVITVIFGGLLLSK